MAKKLKIGMLSKFPPEHDGIAIYSESLCRELPCDVVRIGDRASTNADYQLKLKSMQLGGQLAHIINKESIDILHVQHIPAGQYYGKYSLNFGLIRALNQKVPVVVTFHEVHSNPRGIKDKVIIRIQNKIAAKCDAAIAHTTQMQSILKKVQPKSFVIAHGCETHKIVPGKKKELLLFGMLHSNKGVIPLMRAMDLLPDFHLTIAGSTSPEYAERLRRIKKGNVTLDLRWIPDSVKREYYERTQIVVLPYRHTPYQSGIATNAMAYGKPLIASDSGGPGDLVRSYKCGEIVGTIAPSTIAQGIIRLSANYKRALAGVRAYRREASWNAVGKLHHDLYLEVLRKS